ncbi:hypothetical protein JCM31447_16680 [Fluviispira sanaruensis]|uniref:Uncharacterized protein n=1 Tax=Fluviispira sanaruensis TaxID=2493639 RepID=A0A4P2VUP5_FLUSA|nr:hypothetical protein JCM31447_16680 [Fluviispira sanaruensis]
MQEKVEKLIKVTNKKATLILLIDANILTSIYWCFTKNFRDLLLSIYELFILRNGQGLYFKKRQSHVKIRVSNLRILPN